MTADQLRQKYLDFFAARGHAIIPSAPLVPQNDPTTLFTSSGMQPLVNYLLGEKHSMGTRLANSQKCFRAEDIEEVGDNRHTTFFEMLGNWSLGDYFKKDQLPWFFEFLTEDVGLEPAKLFVTVFSGDPQNNIPKDQESVTIWKELFSKQNIDAKDVELITQEHGHQKGMQGGRIFYFDAKKNWWSRDGIPENMRSGEPGGPDSEVFYDFGTPHDKSFGQHCHPNCDCGRFLEIGNSVFMEYKKEKDGSFSKLPQQNVDFGGGFERILAASTHCPDIFQTDFFKPLINQIEKHSQNTYEGNEKSMRIISDHLRAATLMVSEGVNPGSKGHGSVVRRLIRRAYDNIHGPYDSRTGTTTTTSTHTQNVVSGVVTEIISIYETVFEIDNKDEIKSTIHKELDVYSKLVTTTTTTLAPESSISGKQAFMLYSTKGLSPEQLRSRGYDFDQEEFEKEFNKHKNLSRSASAGMFKGGLADHSEATTKLHTATHLLHKALRNILGDHVRQEGSNITADRLRFDFTHQEKLTDQEIKDIETEINRQIRSDLPVTKSIEDRDQALKSGAMAFFKEKYPDKVSVYTIGDKSNFYSKELCGGPHVSSTGQIGTVRISKQESIGSGKRRLYATIAQ